MNGLESHPKPQVSRLEAMPPHPASLSEIARSLQDVMNRPTVDEVLEMLNAGQNIRNIVVMGCPGGGKSSIINGLEQILNSAGFNVRRKSYEQEYAKFVEKKQQEDPEADFSSEANMTEENRKLLRAHIEQAALASLSESSHNGQQSISLWEIPAVGEQDRGMQAVKALGSNMDKAKTIFVHVVGQPEIYSRAKEARIIIHESVTFDEMRARLTQIGIHVQSTHPSVDNATRLEQYKRMATAKQIDTIQEEFHRLAQAMIEDQRARNPTIITVLLSNLRHPPIESNSETILREGLLFAYLQASQEIFPNLFNSPNLMGYFFVVANMFLRDVEYAS